MFRRGFFLKGKIFTKALKLQKSRGIAKVEIAYVLTGLLARMMVQLVY